MKPNNLSKAFNFSIDVQEFTPSIKTVDAITTTMIKYITFIEKDKTNEDEIVFTDNSIAK